MKTIDLTTLQGWNDLPDGTYDITVAAKAEGYVREKQSLPVSVTKEATIYSITTSVINGTYSGASSAQSGEEAVVWIKPNVGYDFPSSITVTNAQYIYYGPGSGSASGAIRLSNPTGNVSITAECPAITYNIITTVSNGSYSGSSTISYNGTATITITADADYTLPSSITVINAQYTYDSSTGIIVLSNPTGNVSVSIVCESGSSEPTIPENGILYQAKVLKNLPLYTDTIYGTDTWEDIYSYYLEYAAEEKVQATQPTFVEWDWQAADQYWDVDSAQDYGQTLKEICGNKEFWEYIGLSAQQDMTIVFGEYIEYFKSGGTGSRTRWSPLLPAASLYEYNYFNALESVSNVSIGDTVYIPIFARSENEIKTAGVNINITPNISITKSDNVITQRLTNSTDLVITDYDENGLATNYSYFYSVSSNNTAILLSDYADETLEYNIFLGMMKIVANDSVNLSAQMVYDGNTAFMNGNNQAWSALGNPEKFAFTPITLNI